MSSFRALNVEPEEDSTEEIDDSREVHLEDAFKLYQNALRLHSLGAEFSDQAAHAYEDLFKSEIFHYPDSTSEYHRNELDSHGEIIPLVEHNAPQLEDLPSATLQAAPSSLPQILYLAFKNYGQFLLEQWIYRSSSNGDLSGSSTMATRDLVVVCIKALQHFAEALENDDTDLDLWRKAARISRISRSTRIFRFCLESVLAGDDEETNVAAELLGLDEAIASSQLKHLIDSLQDDLSRMQKAGAEVRPCLLKLLDTKSRPLAFLPVEVDTCETTCSTPAHQSRLVRYTISDPMPSWASVGQAVLDALNESQGHHSSSGSASAVYLDIPMEIARSVMKRPSGQSASHKKTYKPVIVGLARGAAEDTELEMRAITTMPEHENSGHTANEVREKEQDILAELGPYPVARPLPAETSLAIRREDGNIERLGVEDGDLVSPNRKRSLAVAGHDDPPDGGRSKSKRLRNRESNLDAVLQKEQVATSPSRLYENQTTELANADDRLFSAESHLLEKLEIHGLGLAEDLRQDALLISEEFSEQELPSNVLNMIDLRTALMLWSGDTAEPFAHNMDDTISGGGKTGLAALLKHSETVTPKKDKYLPHKSHGYLVHLAKWCNESWHSAYHVALGWLETLICPVIAPNALSSSIIDGIESSSYMKAPWPEGLKKTVVQFIDCHDDYLYEAMRQRLEDFIERSISSGEGHRRLCAPQDTAFAEMAQTLYELHLDVYSNSTNADGEIDIATCTVQRDRLDRWSKVASSWVGMSVDGDYDHPSHRWYVIRFLWTTVAHAKLAEDASQEHIMLCLEDLRNLLDLSGNPILTLPNNDAMPEISISALEREISRVDTLDFFSGIFDTDSSDPIVVIESLEPILEPHTSHCQPLPTSPTDGHNCTGPTSVISRTRQLVEFLKSSDTSFKVTLWCCLRDAYIAIDYPPRVVSCYLRIIEAIVFELCSERHSRLFPAPREEAMLKYIKDLDQTMTKLLDIISNEVNPFEIIDNDHIGDVTLAVSRLCRLLHGVELFEGCFRFGRSSEAKGMTATSSRPLGNSREKFEDIYTKARMLQYVLMKEGIAQASGRFDAPINIRAEFLRSLHRALGERAYYKSSNKTFLTFLKTEYMSMEMRDKCTADIAQVVYDLYRLPIAAGIRESLDHYNNPEPLDKKSAVQILEFVILEARGMNSKDLLRSDLKATIEKFQQTIGPPKATPTMSYNRRTINGYLRSPISHLQLLRACRGEGDIPVRMAKTESVKIASLGWYFLLANLALARFKMTKRTNVGPTDDLDSAMTLLRYDLEHDIRKWETWFRLGQVHDAKIEEDLLWTAEKVNSHRRELATLQRGAIHCYEMAMIFSIRDADETVETANKISEMYACFATRLYASSREPLSMEAFENNFQKRPCSNDQCILYQGSAIPSMPLFSVWKLSAHLLRKALIQSPKNWSLYYMLGKCLWKMLTNPGEDLRRNVEVQEVLDKFTESIECLPARKDSRAEPVLEPHFKLVSVVHKLVHRKYLTPSEGCRALQATPWARNVHLADEDDSWEPYVLAVLKKIGHVDKSHWHHRNISRAAHINYDDQQNTAGALGAKHEFTQQIFTKTMSLQIWKPEFERAGRHFVYTSRYVSFFVSILSHLHDRHSMDLLLRRIRRKPGDYLNHQQVWEQVVTSYVGVLRGVAKVLAGYEGVVFGAMDHDVFLHDAGKLEIYAHDPTTGDVTLDIIRDSIELKKLNNSLLKGTLIDDLILDCYALLFHSFVTAIEPGGAIEGSHSAETLADRGESVPNDDNRVARESKGILPTQDDRNLEPSQPHLTSAAGTSANTPKPTKAKAVTRREVQRKAEALALRPPLVKTMTGPKNNGVSPTSKVVVEIPTPLPVKQSGPGTSAHKADSSLVEDFHAGGLAHEEGEDRTIRSTESSRAGSIHDSADDESELSELDESGQALEEELSQEESNQDQTKETKSAAKPFVMFPQLIPTVRMDTEEEVSATAASDDESAAVEPPEEMEVD